MALLSVSGLGIQFGGLKAVEDFSLSMDPGEIVAIIGPNGAGKTTVFNLVTGIYKPSSGRVLLDDEDLVGKKASQIANLGMVRTFQNIRLFKDLSVRKNVEIACTGFAGTLLTPLSEAPGTGKMKGRYRKGPGDPFHLQLKDKASRRRRISLTGSRGSWRLRGPWPFPEDPPPDEPAAGMNQNEIISWPVLSGSSGKFS